MTAARRTCSRSSVCFAEKLSVPKLKWLYARRQFAPQVPAMRVSLVVSFSYLFHHIYTYTDTHTGVLIHTHTYARTHTYTLWEHQQLYPSVLFWLNTWSKHERPWRISAKFFKLCQRSDSQRHIPTPLLPPLHRVVVATPPSDTPCRNWSVWCRGADDSAETGSVPHLGRSGG